jgi:ATP-binding cassette subfamily B protein
MERRKRRHEIDWKYNISLYWDFLKKYKLMFFGVMFVILAIEGIRIISQFLFREIVDSGVEYSAGSMTYEAFIAVLFVVAGIYIVKTIIYVVFIFWRLHIINLLDVNLMADIKRKFFNHLVHLDHNFHTTNKTGSLISRLIRSGGAVERITDVFLFNFAPLILQLVVVSISLLYFSWVTSVIVIVTMVVFIWYSVYMQKVQEGPNIEAINREDIEKGGISDIFTNIASIKYFGQERVVKSKFKNLSEKTRVARLKHWQYYRLMDLVQTLILSTGTFALVFVSIMQFLAGDITMGTVVFIYGVYLSLMGHLFGFVHGVRNYYRAMADFEVLFQYNKISNAIKDKPGAKAMKIRNGDIEFKSVDFRYSKRKIFDDFNLKVPRNKKVALVGHSGCGKSTLVNLLYRLYDVENGAILVDGKDIRDFKQESVRNEMAIVPQEAVLFDDSIWDNIRFSNPKASKDEIWKAIKFAQLDEIISEMPNKEKTIVGERGVKLSGGEKQRVSIARALLANKKILVLDEATSSLDSETEHEIQKDLARLMEGRTSIIIAHRLSTIMHADKIIVMKRGKIVEMGRHSELVRKKGEYYRLWKLQKGGYIK